MLRPSRSLPLSAPPPSAVRRNLPPANSERPESLRPRRRSPRHAHQTREKLPCRANKPRSSLG
jgi:hypothetical protein